MDKLPFGRQNPRSNFIFIVYVLKSLVKKCDNRVKNPSILSQHQYHTPGNTKFSPNDSTSQQKTIIFAWLHATMNSFHSHQRLRLECRDQGVLHSVPGETKCHPSILNSRQMAPKLRRIVHLTFVFYFLFLACFRCLLATHTRLLSFITNLMGRL